MTLRIGGYDVKRVLIDQESGAEIIYPDLCKRLNLKPEDLSKYDSHLVGFDKRTVIPRGMIKLHMQAGNEVMQVNFLWLKLIPHIQLFWQDPGFMRWERCRLPCT